MTDNTHLVDGKYGIRDLVDLPSLQRMFERFTAATGFTIGFLDHPGLNVLIATGWRDICTKFHRSCTISAANCAKSNRLLHDHLHGPGQLVVEKCENGLVDCAFPIIVKGKHIASLATGQLLLEKPDLERFRQQAARFGFDEHAYLKALAEVPVVSDEKLRSMATFLGEMAIVLSEVGYARLAIKENAERLKNEITVRRQTEEALRESEAHYRRLFDLESDAIIVIDATTLANVDVNNTSEAMYGYTRQELLRMKATDLSDEPDETSAQIQQGDGIVHIPFRRHRKKDGTLFYVDISARFFISNGRKMLLTAMRDISERVHAEKERHTLQAQLQQAQKMESVGRLAGGVAHDFNNMLSVILGRTEMALDRMDPSHPLHDDLEEIRKAAQYSADLTRKLLAFGRKQTITPRVLDLNETVGGMLKMLQRLIGEDVDLVWHPAADLWPVWVDPSQIDQILANLCVNARDAISGIGKITIETGTRTFNKDYCAVHAGFSPGNYVLLAVSDNGCGMDKETFSHLFEPYFTTKATGKGTGLGLATVYGIVKQNNGTINVYSEPGHGTTFKIFLPGYTGKANETLRAHDAEPVRGGHEIILLVEDEMTVLKMVSEMLTKQGYTVLAASTAGEAIRLARENGGNIHLLVTDVVMPDMNGSELAKHLLSLYPHLKRLFMSGYTANVIAHHGVLDEGMPFIQKPFSVKDLMAKVRHVLDSK
jgi:PAS domain S-box-containing protein